MASTLPPPNAGGTPTATIGVDLTQLQRAPAVARAAGQATARELEAALTQRRVSVRAAAREETEVQRAALREQAASEKQRVAALNAALTQRRVAVRTAAREEAAIEKQRTAEYKAELRARTQAAQAATAQQRALVRGGATFAGAAFGGPVGGIAGALAGGSAALPLAAGLVAGQGLQFAKQSVQAASDLSESINKVGVAFGASSQEILDWSKNSATALGQSQRGALEAASSFGLLFRSQGLSASASAEMSKRLVELATDMASIHNIRPEDALEKLRAGLIGETEPLRSVGVLLSDQTVRLKAVEMGLAETTAAVNEQERVLARYQIILEQTALTQGDFLRTITGLANQQRIANAQWENGQAKLGKLLEAPVAVTLAGWNAWLSQQIAMMDAYTEAIQRAGRALNLLPAASAAQSGSLGSRTGIGANVREGTPALQRQFTDEQTQLITDRARRLLEMQRQTDKQIVDSATQYAQQRADTIANYDKQIARDSEDYARQRARSLAKYEQSIAEVDSDVAKKRTELADKRDEAIADARAKSQEKLLELEADYNKDRERAERSHRTTILDAAARLDAVAVMQEQRRYAEEKRTRDEDYRDSKAEERKNLDEQLAEQRENYQEQLDAANDAAAERLADLKSSYEEQQRIEEEDRQLRLDRQAADHAAQLAEMDSAQATRIAQIKANAAEERAQYDEEFKRAAVEAGIKIQSWITEHERMTDVAIKNFDRFMDEVIRRTTYGGGITAGESQGLPVSGGGPILSRASGGPVPRTGLAMVHRGEYVLNPSTTAAVRNTLGGFDQASLLAALQGGGGRSVTWTGNMSISIPGGTSASAQELAAVFEPLLMASLEKIASQ